MNNVVLGCSKGLHRHRRGRYTLGQTGHGLLRQCFGVAAVARQLFPPYEKRERSKSKGSSPSRHLHHNAVTLSPRGRHRRKERRWFTLGQLGWSLAHAGDHLAVGGATHLHVLCGVHRERCAKSMDEAVM